MRYAILNSDDAVSLQEAVMEYLAEGWKLQGGVSATLYSALEWDDGEKDWTTRVFYAQAVIKDEP